MTGHGSALRGKTGARMRSTAEQSFHLSFPKLAHERYHREMNGTESPGDRPTLSEETRPLSPSRDDSRTSQGAGPDDFALSVSIVISASEFDSLETVWDQLIGNSDCSVFQTYEWQKTWWSHFGGDKDLHILVFSQAGRVVGIAPAFIETSRVFGIIPMRTFRFIDAGYGGIISNREDEETVAQALAEYLSSQHSEWDLLKIIQIEDRSRWLSSLRNRLDSLHVKIETRREQSCPQLALPTSWDGFLYLLGGNKKSQLKRKRQRLNDIFGMEFELLLDPGQGIAQAVDDFVSINTGRWHSLGYTTRYKEEEETDFLKDIAAKFANKGWLRIMFLKVGGNRIATNFSFAFNGRLYFYEGNANGTEEMMKLSPGFILHCAAIKQAIDEGLHTYDMLYGEEDYKMKEFKGVPVPTWSVRAVSPSTFSSLKSGAARIDETLGRTLSRFLLEYHEVRRFVITKRPSFPVLLRFMSTRVKAILRIAGQNITHS